MADNFTANAGSGGSVFASDEVSINATTVHVPRIKLGHGGDGTYSGDVSTSNPLPVAAYGVAAGGLSVYRSLDVDETEEEVKGSAGTVYAIWGANLSATTAYLKLYNATAANTTVGTTTPVLTLPIPGNATDAVAFNFNLGGLGIEFNTAICIAATTALADAGSVGPSVSAVVSNVLYK